MNRLFVPLICATLLLPAFAHGETFETEGEWADAVVGEAVPTSFGSLIGREYSSGSVEDIEIDGEFFKVFPALSDTPQTFDELPLESEDVVFNPELFPLGGFITPQSLPWGELSSQNDALVGWKDPFLLDSFGFSGDRMIGGQHIEFSPAPELGQLSGISFYLNPNLLGGRSQGTEITFFDGDNPLETVTYSHLEEIDAVAEEVTYIGWTNTQNLNVTRFVITSIVEQFRTPQLGEVEDGADVLIVPFEGSFITDGELVFGEFVTDTSPQELLDEILVDVGSIPATGDKQDDKRIAKAIDRVNAATNPAYFEDGEVLPGLSDKLVRDINKALRELERVESPSPEVEQIIAELNLFLASLGEG